MPTGRPAALLGLWAISRRRAGTPTWAIEGAVVLIALAAALAQGWVTSQTRTQYEEALRGGGNVVIVSSETGSIRAQECDQLATARSDVAWSGSVKNAGTVYSADTPGNAVQAGEVTGDFLAIASGDRATNFQGVGVVLGGLAAESLGASPGSLLEWSDVGPLEVLGVVEFDQRGAGFGIWRLAAAASVGCANECWVEAEPGMRDSVADTILSSLPSSPDASVGVLHNETPEEAVESSLRTAHRVLPWLAAAAATVMAALLIFVERQAISLFRLLGMRTVDLVLLGWLRALTVVFVSSVASAAAFVAIKCLGVPWVDRTGLLGLVPLIVAILMTMPLAMATPRRNLLVDLRDR